MNLQITHPEKVMFPDDGITKGELADYYEMIAPRMVPHLRARPVTMERFHRGIGSPGFFHKNVGRGAPAWLERVAVPKKDGVVQYPLITDTRGLLWLANQNCITPHGPRARLICCIPTSVCSTSTPCKRSLR
jgi:bifunctional non-homologous end joining protein LigD